jgi:hypothetical protein
MMVIMQSPRCSIGFDDLQNAAKPFPEMIGPRYQAQNQVAILRKIVKVTWVNQH